MFERLRRPGLPVILVSALCLATQAHAQNDGDRTGNVQGQSGAEKTDRDSFSAGLIQIDGSFSGLLSRNPGLSSEQVSDVRVPIRYLIADQFAVGVDSRYWANGYYPFSGATAAMAFGPSARFYTNMTKDWSGYVGGSLLWVPQTAEALLTPEVGLQYFISNGLAIGACYTLMSTFESYVSQVQDPRSSSQSLSIELSLFH